MGRYGAAALFLACILTANITAAAYGLIHIGPLAFTAGTFAAGLALLARDVVQDAAGRRAVFALILIGGALSWALNDALTNPLPGGPTAARIAAASAAAFTLSELADMAVYTPLRAAGWNRAVLASNAAGALVDSVVFLALSGFGLSANAVAGQWLVKMAVTVATVATIAAARVTLKAPA